MESPPLRNDLYGLVGRNISYSFSQNYFTQKFAALNLHQSKYQNFDISDIAQFPEIIRLNPNLRGLNVTIPYKQSIIPYLDSLSEIAREIGAVNTIKIENDGTLTGYNTDWYGFKQSIEPMLLPHHKNALILGTGGASKAVAYALRQLGIGVTLVSTTENEKAIPYQSLNAAIMDEHLIIINCTPLGTSPNITAFPTIPYDMITNRHIAFDLIYNPEQTLFLEKAAAKGALVKNGYEMLVNQAEKSWEIWQL